jgi:hypothetical protein
MLGSEPRQAARVRRGCQQLAAFVPGSARPQPQAAETAQEPRPGVRGSADGRTADFVQSLERGFAVVRAFGAERPRLTLSEVAKATGLTRAATRRFLLTRVQLGYARTKGRVFSLRPRVLELGYAYLSALGLRDLPRVSFRRGGSGAAR